MRHAVRLPAILLLLPRLSAAQQISIIDTDGARAAVAAGYGGHGVDLQASVESRLLWDRVRLRAALGHGRWDEHLLLPSAGATRLPRVTRLGFSLIRFSQVDRHTPVRGYGGAGFTLLAPHGAMEAHGGVHVLLGLEANAERWSFGPELVVEVPAYDRSWRLLEGRTVYLAPAARITVGLKRRF